MKEYQVRIKETLEMTVTVEAGNAAEARAIVEQRYKDSEYILDADNFTGVTFSAPSRPERER